MGKNYEEDDDDAPEMTVTLSLDNGETVECSILTIVEAGGRDYIVLLPMDDDEENTGDIYIYRYIEDENGEPSIDNITDDDEYEMAADAFDEWLDEQEYDELIDEDDV